MESKTNEINELPLLEENGIQYFLLKQHHCAEVVPILATCFANDPLGVMLDLGYDFWYSLYDIGINKMGNLFIDNGLSVVAIDKETGKVCGTFI